MNKVYLIASIFTVSIFMINCQNSAEKNNESEMKIEQNDGKNLLFVGSYTRKEGHVDDQANGIYTFYFDSNTGELEPAEYSAEVINLSYISVDGKNKLVYSVSETADGPNREGMIKSFSYVNNNLKETGSLDALGGAPCHITKFKDHILTANYLGGNFCVYKLDKNGNLKSNSQNLQNEGKGITPRQEGPHAHMINTNPLNGLVYTIDLGIDKVGVYSLNERIGIG